jgi:putative transcriptional regulator
MNNIVDGTLLIAEPFLKDASFKRSVVLLCKYGEGFGAFGFSLHRKLKTTLNEVIEDMDDCKLPIYFGGPVEIDTLHYIHQYPQYFDDAVKITDNLYWGGDFEKMKLLIKAGKINPKKIKFFLGYSGWDDGQLEEELKESSWIISTANNKLIFDTMHSQIWRTSLGALGGKYKIMVNFPEDPQLN